MSRNRALVGAVVGILAGGLSLAPAALADGHGGNGAVSGTVTSFSLQGTGTSSSSADGSITISEANGSTETIAIAPSTTIDMSAGVLAGLLGGGASTAVVTVALSASGSGTPVAREIRVAESGDQAAGNGAGPKGESYVGVISAVSGTSITIGQYTLTLSQNVRVSYGDRRLMATAIPTGVRAKVSLDHSGNVTQVRLLADPSIPRGESVQGTITAASATSITIGQYTLALAPDAVIKYHDFKLAAAEIPTGVKARAKLGKDLAVGKIILLTDPNLPPAKELHGAVTAVGTGTLSLDGYTLNVDPQAAIAYQGTAYTLASIQSGWDVKVHLDAGGNVVQIKIVQGPQQAPGSGGSSQGGN